MNMSSKLFTCAIVIAIKMNLPAADRVLTLEDHKRIWLEQQQRKTEKERALVAELHQLIVANSRETGEAEMRLYTNTISVTNRSRYTPRPSHSMVVSVMVPIQGGEFVMGSPDTEAHRRPDEGPQRKVKISPFWMQQCEVTWDEFRPFMYNIEESHPQDATNTSHISDAVSKPSKPYLEYSFGMGISGFPAVAMTQHAANKYCQWLSAKTGHFYRLPTEAEWEYACRAGTTNAYVYGNDPQKLRDYAWFYENNDSKYQKVGRKKPNPWGLYDMHGNVAEWCLDQYDPIFYGQQKGELSINPWNKATQPYPHVVRGGSWDDDPEQLRSANREKSDKSWKLDTSLPQSSWYMDQAKTVGFRVVRPLKVPADDEMFQYWNNGVEVERPPGW
jgi:formylglycine-generating enzyme required for sulfatase activity